MKVVILASGRSFHATRWASALSKKNIEVIFISINALTRKLDKKIKHIQIGNEKKYYYFLSAFRFRKLLKEIKPDIIHSHYASGYGLLGYLSNLFLYIPRITSLYGAEVFDFPNKSFLHAKLLEIICSSSVEVFSTSRVMANVFSGQYPNLPSPTITPFGVDLSIFDPVRFPKKNDSKFISIGLVKKLEKKYGVDVLIEAVSILVKKYKVKVILKVAGDGVEKQNLINLAANLDISELISFSGWIDNDDVPEFLSSLDIVVIPSRFESESFGVAAVESLAMRKPTIVSNVGGLPEVVENNISGYVIEKENPDELALKIWEIINDKAGTAFVAREARLRVVKYFDWNNNVNLVVNQYAKIIGD